MIKTPSKVLTQEEAMAYLKEHLKVNSRSTFYRLIKQGKLKGINLNEGGKYAVRRFAVEELDALIAEMTSEVVTNAPENLKPGNPKA
jgi:hypothetical protein